MSISATSAAASVAYPQQSQKAAQSNTAGQAAAAQAYGSVQSGPARQTGQGHHHHGGAAPSESPDATNSLNILA